MSTEKYVSRPVPLPSPQEISAAGKAVIELTGVDQAGPSFEARVFLNNPDAGPDTPQTPEHGYAGSFHVYGFGLQADVDGPASTTNTERAATLVRVPVQRSLDATEAVRRAAAQGSTATVTVVPSGYGGQQQGKLSLKRPLTIDQVSIRTDAA